MDQEFPTLVNDTILRVAAGEKTSRIPIWIMRQAGRYLPEFQEIRKDHDFFEIVNNPELASEVTLQPIKRYDLDAAIIFSDILVIPQAVGMEVKMVPKVGPVITSPLDKPDDISKLDFDCDVLEKMKGTLDSITLTRKKLEGKVPLLGFSGAPWTLMSYMIEGGGSRTISKAKSWLYKYPNESHKLLSLINKVVINYLVEQVAYGAQMVQVFESHAEILGPKLFNTFCIPVLKSLREQFLQELHNRQIKPVPMVIFAKGGHYALQEIDKLGYEVVGLDWTIDPELARKSVSSSTVLQGNLDPCALYGDQNTINENVQTMISRMGRNNYICNLGHGIYPDIPTESVKYFIDAVHSFNEC